MTNKNEINKDELNDFVIGDEDEKTIDSPDDFGDLDVTTIGKVDQFDFNSDDEFDLEESFEYVKHAKIEPSMTKEAIQQQEADNIVKTTASSLMEQEYVDVLNKEHDNLLAMLKRYDVNSELVKSMNEEEKDKIYKIAEYLFNNFQQKLNKMNFSFDLERRDWKFLINTLNKMEFDQNEIFQLKEIKDHWLDSIVELEKSIPKSMDTIPSMINVNDIIVLYHLIAKYKVKGMRDEYNAYLSVLTKIGERIKLFNAYNVWIQRLSADFQSWGGSLTVDDSAIKPTVEGSAISPEKPNEQ